ncbi:MAG: hypothetical protein ABI589_01475 [Burkholderiales bacterium]
MNKQLIGSCRRFTAALTRLGAAVAATTASASAVAVLTGAASFAFPAHAGQEHHAALVLAQAPASSSAPPAASVTAPAGPKPTTTALAPAGVQRQLPVNAQGAASLGVTVRVKDILIGPDATILTVSASFSSRMTHSTDLASTDTFLELPGGDRLPIKRPANNRYLSIKDGETMEGQLVFLGAVPPSATEVRLVFNEGNAPDDSIGPGLAMTLPLKDSATR